MNSDSFTVRLSVPKYSLIEGSIAHNFPKAPNSLSPVFCTDQSSGDQYWVVCRNVGQLSTGTTYQLALKAAFLMDGSDDIVGETTSFGAV
jgi:hypothetical protein